MKKIFSIIVPTYNEEKYIESLLESLRKQAYDLRKVEVIVVNNGSVDLTMLKVKRYKNRHKRFPLKVTTAHKRHVSSARNKGASIARGKYLIFLDADNIAHPELLRNIYKKITSGRGEAGTICTFALEESVGGHLLFMILECIKVLIKRPFGKNYCAKSLFHKVRGYNENITIGTNIDFLIRLEKYLRQKNSSLVHIQTPVYASLRRFEREGYRKVLLKWLCGYMGIRNIAYPSMNLLN